MIKVKVESELDVLYPYVHRFLLECKLKTVAVQFKNYTKTKTVTKDAATLLDMYKAWQVKSSDNKEESSTTNGQPQKQMPNSSSSEESSEQEAQPPSKKQKLTAAPDKKAESSSSEEEYSSDEEEEVTPKATKKILQIVAILSVFVLASGNSMSGNFQICNLQCSNDETGDIHQNPITNSSPNSRFLRGKSGPIGEKGSQGDAGVKGDAGVSCNLTETAQLRRRIAQVESDLDKIRNLEAVVKIPSNGNKWEYCGVGIQVDPNTGSSVISDDRMTASTTHNNNGRYVPHNGRLFGTAGVGAWGPKNHDRPNCWIQVDLGSEKTIHGLVTQGAHHQNLSEWVTSYEVSYQRNSGGFRSITDQSGTAMVFQGNTDRNTPVTNSFPEPVSGRYFRVHPKSYHTWPLLRFELLTC